MTVTMFEAKTKLSELVRKAQAGEEVIITSGRDRKPVVRLQPVEPAPLPMRLGIMQQMDLQQPDGFWEPLSADEFSLGDNPMDPLNWPQETKPA